MKTLQEQNKPPFNGRKVGQRGSGTIKPPFYRGKGEDLKSWWPPKKEKQCP